MGSLGERMGTSKTQDYVLLGALAVAAYVLYNLVSAAKTGAQAIGTVATAVGHAYTSAVDAVSSGLYALFGPADIGTNVYYTTNFPDGSRHAIPSNLVNASGVFTWTGYPAGSESPQSLQLVKDANGAWYATTAAPSPEDFGLANPSSWSS